MSRAEIAIRELGTRSLSGTFGHVLMLITAQVIAPGAGTFSRPLVFSLLGVFIALRVVARHFALTQPGRRGTLALLATGAICCNGLWGLVAANVQSDAGIGLPAVVYAFFLCGIATGSIGALAPSSVTTSATPLVS